MFLKRIYLAIWFLNVVLGFPQGERSKIDKTVQANPMINKGLFEGDMKGITHETIDALVKRSNNIRLIASSPGANFTQEGAAIADPFAVWPNKQLFYEITNDFKEEEKKIIRESLEEYHSKTCIKMVPRTDQKDYVTVKKISGCWSAVGRQGGAQELSLGIGCVDHGVIVHEFMHALGFFHEQSRWDRDDYVEIHKENIIPGEEKNFNKYDLTMLKDLHTDYDYKSVMHYRKDAFSKNGDDTITPIKPNVEIGNQLGLSDIDVLELQRMYDCDTTTVTEPPKPVNPLTTGTEPPTPVGPLTPGIIQSGSRLYGHYTQYNVKDAEECRTICMEQIECAGMTFDTQHTYSFGNCFLGKTGFTIKDDKTWSTWIKENVPIDSIQPFLRLSTPYKESIVKTADECKTKCQDDNECYAMSFLSESSPGVSNCFKFNSKYVMTSDTAWSSWMKGSIKNGIKFTVNPYSGLRKIKTVEACVRNCQKDPQCQAMNFYDGYYDSDEYGNCFLFEENKDYGKASQGGTTYTKFSAWVKGQV